ncbi:unnamed protein product [Schistosoma curassoni]|uniref:Signal peptide protein n=1 Tax=Schistosoma curassoni TaxID=6186 RepID=A0A183JCC1_9TREM|nr:unnamed protein product [Schistosoma curassoni]
MHCSFSTLLSQVLRIHSNILQALIDAIIRKLIGIVLLVQVEQCFPFSNETGLH